MEDALDVGITRDRDLIEAFLRHLQQRLRPLPYGRWTHIDEGGPIEVRLQPAGHILDSAYVECRTGVGTERERVLFSGDLGARWSPLLPAPRSPWGADVVVLESS
jgi:metallo-beta-lactamase family protein